MGIRIFPQETSSFTVSHFGIEITVCRLDPRTGFTEKLIEDYYEWLVEDGRCLDSADYPKLANALTCRP